jgi:CRP/FNR family cyclic AMP-dependent transcriptional regulator
VNQIVGEMALFSDESRSATVTAIVTTTVNEVETTKFSTYLKQQPDWHRVLIQCLLQKIRAANDKLIVYAKN